jgi:hypothetical protein
LAFPRMGAITSGQQVDSTIFNGYADRSKGIHSVVELAVHDAADMSDFVKRKDAVAFDRLEGQTERILYWRKIC